MVRGEYVSTLAWAINSANMHNMGPGSEPEKPGGCATKPQDTKSMLLLLNDFCCTFAFAWTQKWSGSKAPCLPPLFVSISWCWTLYNQKHIYAFLFKHVHQHHQNCKTVCKTYCKIVFSDKSIQFSFVMVFLQNPFQHVSTIFTILFNNSSHHVSWLRLNSRVMNDRYLTSMYEHHVQCVRTTRTMCTYDDVYVRHIRCTCTRGNLWTLVHKKMNRQICSCSQLTFALLYKNKMSTLALDGYTTYWPQMSQTQSQRTAIIHSNCHMYM